MNFNKQIEKLSAINNELNTFSKNYNQDNVIVKKNFEKNLKQLEKTRADLGTTILEANFPLSPLKLFVIL